MTDPQTRLPVLGPHLHRLLAVVFVLFGLLALNSVYLGAVSLLEHWLDTALETTFYLNMFLAHLVLGVVIIVPFIAYGVMHAQRGWRHPNRNAVRAGIGLLLVATIVLVTGLGLTRDIPLVELRNPTGRDIAYWLHVITPLLVIWGFILHRLAGPPIRWTRGLAWTAACVVATAAALIAHYPRATAELASVPCAATSTSSNGAACAPLADEQRAYYPSLAQTSNQQPIAADVLMMDDYCRDCHRDSHAAWSVSAHRYASFNNPAYRFSVRNTRKVALERHNDTHANRFCAGCHDPVPLFSGALDKGDFNDETHPTAHAGITCSVCHGIVGVGSPRGNGDYVIEAPKHYPFASSEVPLLKWLNHTLVKAKPQFHKRTFLKPVHKSAEFCSTCHKVNLPRALNHYKWLRGQNHYDSYLLSGVSGHGTQSFYYPPKAVPRCAGCHMPLQPSDEFGAQADASMPGKTVLHDHQFPAANTALSAFFGLPPEVNKKHEAMLKKAMRVDIFALHEADDMSRPAQAPLENGMRVEAGHSYIVDVVLRTVGVGHHLTEGTIDSNEIWLALTLRAGERVIARSGALEEPQRSVDADAHFLNAYVIDREGKRIDRRNVEDIFTRLYDHQIPPGAADVAQYRLDVPADVDGPLTIEASVHYRKFDAQFAALFNEQADAANQLPIVEMAHDRVQLRVGEGAAPAASEANARAISKVAAWERWNDYGIGFLRKPNRAALRPAEYAFKQVAAAGKGVGALNLARVYLNEGRIDEAASTLASVPKDDSVLPWSLAYYTALANIENGFYDDAITALETLVATGFAEARKRGFDFSKDYRLHVTLGQAHYDRARQGGDAQAQARDLEAAIKHFDAALVLDPENTAALYGLSQVYARQGQNEQAQTFRERYEQYRVDDNARDHAVAAARLRDPAANRAAEAVVIYPLKAPDATNEAASAAHVDKNSRAELSP